MTTIHSPKQDSHFSFAKRLEFVPKGLSPIFTETKKIDTALSPNSKESLHKAILESYENELNTVKWSHYIFDHNDANTFFEQLYREKTKQFESCVPNTSEFPKSIVKLYSNTQALSFSKDIFNELEIIGQLDRKFIVTMIKNQKLVILFDQHAVHERIRLEKLLNEYKHAENDNDIVKFRSTKLNKKIVLMFMVEELNILKNFKNCFEALGLRYDGYEDRIEVTHAPTCLLNKFSGCIEKSKDYINSLIYEQITMIVSTRGVISKMPTLLQNIVNLEACRGAIKFGDKLTVNDCEEHIKELSRCRLPFQCAHGRPTLVPAVRINQKFEMEKINLNLKKLKNV